MEKLANHIALQSIAEGGMEKRAFNVAQLLRMGRNFALRGKLDRFNKLMDRRAQAAASSRYNRSMAWLDALDENAQVKNYLLDGDANPVLGKLLSAEKRNIRNPIGIIRNPNPQARAAVDVDAKNDLAGLLDLPAANRNNALNATPSYDTDQLETFSKALRRLDPALHKKVLMTGSF